MDPPAVWKRKYSQSARVIVRSIFRLAAIFSAGLFAVSALADSPRDAFPAASLTPEAQSGWEKYAVEPDPSAPFDEAMGGVTRRGTHINKRGIDCFPTESRNLFRKVDQLPTGPGGKLQPINFTEQGRISQDARDAIRGQNTWMLWGEGNESFWGWLQEDGYGIADFLIMIDSRKRARRFADGGLINQPGMTAQTDKTKRILGLYIDQVEGDKIPPGLSDTYGQTTYAELPPACRGALFTPGDPDLYERVVRALPKDGVDPTVYGYPSGVLGLRLLPNPDFFGNTADAKAAREYWQERVVESDDHYYTDPEIYADPNLVRPFRVSMSCAYCHVAPHPLNPPDDPESPLWENLSSIIGNQYWRATRAFANLRQSRSFMFQFVASQQPGTIDTSLASTDHINNANAMNAIFDVPARLERAKLNPAEEQSPANLLLRSTEDPPQSRANPRHTPRALVDGSDSIGLFGAFARVYLNIGAYSEQWNRLHNPIIGFTRQRPFALATLQAKSVYWQTTEKYRIDQLLKFFGYTNKETGESVTAPMKLADTPEGRSELTREAALADAGRGVFLRNCAICHSSRQPPDFALDFKTDWAKQQDLHKASDPGRIFLPMDFADWEEFKRSDAYRDYTKRVLDLFGDASPTTDPFLQDNFLSTDIRVPVTLVGTNSGRAVGTNGMAGQMWDNFSSKAYKKLSAVGAVRFYNPYSGIAVDQWGNNDAYAPPENGPGYYRPPSLISLWATAPFFHNNTLGQFTGDPTVPGRLQAFDDAVDRLLWKEKRASIRTGHLGDLRFERTDLAGSDPGFIYRTTTRSWIDFPHRFIRPLLVGVIGKFWTSFLTLYLWLGLAAIALPLVFVGKPRYAGAAFALVALASGVVLHGLGIDSVYPGLWWVPGIAAVLALLLWLVPQTRLFAVLLARVTFGAIVPLALFAAFELSAFVDGKRGDLRIGPIPEGTPVNLIMNLNPEAPTGVLIDALGGLTRGLLRIGKENLGDRDGAALRAFEAEAGAALLKASKCPDFVLDRGHWFAESLTDDEKEQLKAFLKTL